MIGREVQRGQIFMAELSNGVGSVQGGRRPVVVVSNKLNNKFSPTLNVLPITSRVKNNIPVHINVGANCGLKTESTILTEQILTIDKLQLIHHIGHCDNETLVKIAKALALQTSLQDGLVMAQ